MCLFAETHYTTKCRPLLRLSDHEISLFIPSLDITGGDVQRKRNKLAATLSSMPFPDDPHGNLCNWRVQVRQQG
jgi:hypothetical protein